MWSLKLHIKKCWLYIPNADRFYYIIFLGWSCIWRFYNNRNNIGHLILPSRYLVLSVDEGKEVWQMWGQILTHNIWTYIYMYSVIETFYMTAGMEKATLMVIFFLICYIYFPKNIQFSSCWNNAKLLAFSYFSSNLNDNDTFLILTSTTIC